MCRIQIFIQDSFLSPGPVVVAAASVPVIRVIVRFIIPITIVPVVGVIIASVIPAVVVVITIVSALFETV